MGNFMSLVEEIRGNCTTFVDFFGVGVHEI